MPDNPVLRVSSSNAIPEDSFYRIGASLPTGNSSSAPVSEPASPLLRQISSQWQQAELFRSLGHDREQRRALEAIARAYQPSLPASIRERVHFSERLAQAHLRVLDG